MKIAADTLITARHFAGGSQTFPHAMQAMQTAEGPDPDAIVRAVKCSDPSVQNRQDALLIQARTLTHHLSDFIFQYYAEQFATYLGAHWAPLGVENDPQNLNKNWITNFLAALREPVQ